MSPEQLAAAAAVAIGDIDDEMAGISPLIDLAAHRRLDFIETAAAAQVMQSVYSGIEGLMLLVAKKIDNVDLGGQAWHQTLLDQMSLPTHNRPRMFSEATVEKMRIYLGFRHLVRHNYSHRLREDRVRDLLLGLPEFWGLVKSDLINFHIG